MQAFILAAGLGTRLRPLTNSKPKAMVELSGKPLIDIVLTNLIRQGATRVVVNVHHMADQIIDFLGSKTWGADIAIADERAKLLDTGGGLRHAAPLFDASQPIVMHNVDIISTIDLQQLLHTHTTTQALATLAVSDRPTSRKLLFSQQGQLVGWHNSSNDDYLWADKPIENAVELAFSGISILDPKLPLMLPNKGDAFPIVPELVALAGKYAIGHMAHRADDWVDVGKIEALAKAESILKKI